MRIARLIALGGLLFPAAAAAQDSPRTVPRGSEVRLYTSSAFAAGRLDTLTDTTIVILDGRNRRTFATSSVTQFQVRQPGGEWQDTPVLGLRLVPKPAAAPKPADARVLSAGDRVRVYHGRRRDEGTLFAVRADSVFLRGTVDSNDVGIPLAAIRSIEVVRGQRGNLATGLVLGFLAGAAGGALAGAAADDEDSEFYGVITLAGAGAGGLLGAVVGAVIGGSSRSDRWVRVPADRLRVEAMTLGGVGLRIAIRF